MTDLAQALSEIKSLPDEALQRELAQPTGMIPGFLALSELHERKSMRSGGTNASKGPVRQPKSMAEEFIGDIRKYLPTPAPPQMPQGPPGMPIGPTGNIEQGMPAGPPSGPAGAGLPMGMGSGIQSLPPPSSGPAGYADGGIVSLAKGGPVRFPFKLTGGALRADAISGLDPRFLASLNAMYAAAPEAVQKELGLTSAFRDINKQTELWNKALQKYKDPEIADNWVARPGTSFHNKGLAADLSGFGIGEGRVSPATKQWVRDNAGNWNLGFPLSNEDWHIQYLDNGQGQTVPTVQVASAQPTWTDIQNSIAGIESAGSGDYSAVGPATKGDRPWGRYQIMGKNIPQWTEQHLGVRMTPEQFLANPQAQDAVFQGQFGNYINRYGLEGAAQAWLGGPGSVGKLSAKDVLGTSVGSYGQRFMAGLNNPTTAAQAAANAGQAVAMNAAAGAGQAAAADTAGLTGMGGIGDLMLLASMFQQPEPTPPPALAPQAPYVAMTPADVQATSATPNAYAELQARRMRRAGYG